MISKKYIKVGNRVKYIGSHHLRINKCATISWTNIRSQYVEFRVVWDHIPDTSSYYTESDYSYFAEDNSPAPKKYYRRATKKDFKPGQEVRCKSKRKGGAWKNECGSIHGFFYKDLHYKRFVINWFSHDKRKGRRETWSDFTKNFEIPITKKKKKKKIKLRSAPIDTALPILQAGHIQDRLFRRSK